MSDLSPEDRALIDAGGRDDLPSAASRDRVRRRLAVRLGAGAGLGIATAATKTAAATTAVTSLTMKVVLGAVLIGVVGAGGAALGVAVRDRSAKEAGAATTTATVTATAAATAMAMETATATATATKTETETATATKTETATPVVETSPPSLPAPTAKVVAAAPVAAAAPEHARAGASEPPSEPVAVATPPRGDVSPPPVTSVDALAEETRLLRAADAATRAGDPSRALALLEEHARRFPGGVLGEERDAERVLALCAAGRTADARAAAQRFLSARPSSALAGRVRSSCGGS